MKIGFQANILQGHRTGINNYSYNVLRSLSQFDPELQFFSPGLSDWKEVRIEGQTPDEIADEARAARLSDLSRFMKSQLIKIRGVRYLHHRVNSTAHILSYRSRSITLFHAFNYVPPAKPVVPVLPVVYDLSFIRFPGMHPKERVRRLSALPKLIENAGAIHTISEFSKQEIVEVFGYPADRIAVAYPAAADLYRPLGIDASLLDLQKYDLKARSYLLAVGTLEPRKNIRTLIAAYSKLSFASRSRFPLVIVGGKGWGKTDLPVQTSSLVSEGSIRFLGYVSNAALRSLYENTRLMLFPSIYEGFGMPVVEAMACGAPVLHSEKTSMDEITNGLLAGIPALDVDAWFASMREAISSEAELTLDRRQQRIDRAHRFDWMESAKIVRKAYDSVIGPR